ncbi:MAG: lamin tail domain-containing protein [Planctomycetota bacterium]
MTGIASGFRLMGSRMNRFLVAAAVLLLALASEAPGYCAVVINEIHYNPPAPEGRDLEFVELFNPGNEAVSLDGWKLEGGISFEFPSGLVLPAGGMSLSAVTGTFLPPASTCWRPICWEILVGASTMMEMRFCC